MAWQRMWAVCGLAAGVLVACDSGGEERVLPRVDLSTVDFAIASAAFSETFAEPGGPAIGWTAVASGSGDTCGALDSRTAPPGFSFLQLHVIGDTAGACPVVAEPVEAASGCQALVRLGRQVDEDLLFTLAPSSGSVRATLRDDGSMAWEVSAVFLKDAQSSTSCEGGLGPDGEEGVWTCLSAAGELRECAASCWSDSAEGCCNAGRTETETLEVAFVAPRCDGTGGNGGTGGTGGEPSCERACAKIRECADPESRDRCLADCEAAMEESCRSCYSSLECGDSCASACPTARCWSDFECDLEAEYCDLEATEPRCQPISGGGRGGAGGGD